MTMFVSCHNEMVNEALRCFSSSFCHEDVKTNSARKRWRPSNSLWRSHNRHDEILDLQILFFSSSCQLDVILDLHFPYQTIIMKLLINEQFWSIYCTFHGKVWIELWALLSRLNKSMVFFLDLILEVFLLRCILLHLVS